MGIIQSFSKYNKLTFVIFDLYLHIYKMFLAINPGSPKFVFNTIPLNGQQTNTFTADIIYYADDLTLANNSEINVLYSRGCPQ